MVWSGVYPPNDSMPCDICNGNIDVERKMIQVTSCGCVKSLISHGQSNLCKTCKEKGWMIFADADMQGNITYYNFKTEEFKYSK